MSLQLALGQLLAHAGRYLATVLAIAVSVAFVLASAGVLRTMTDSVDAVFGLRYRSTDVLIEHVGDRTSASTDQARAEVAESARQTVEALRGIPGVRAVTIDSNTYVRMKAQGRAQQMTTATALSTDEALRWQPLAQGRLPAAPGEVAVRADGGLNLGERVDVQPSGADEPTSATVVGLLDLAGQPDLKGGFPLYTVDEQVQRWAENTGGAGGDVRVAGDGTVAAEELETRVRDRLAAIPGSDAFTVTTGAAAAQELTGEFIGDRTVYTRTLVAFTILAVAVASLVIATTFAVVFAARVREMALLRCLGATRTQVRLSALTESALVAVLATAAGLALGRWGVDVIAANAHRLGVTVPMQRVSVPDRAWLLAAAVGLVVTLATAVPPILRATSGSPLLALRPTDVRPEPWWRRALLVLVGASVAAVAWYGLGLAVEARLVVRAGAWGVLFFLGALAVVSGALPTVLGLLGAVTGLLLGPIGMLGARNTARSPRRTASTAAAVLVGVTLTATMVTGIALLGPSIQARLVDRIPLDVAVTSPDGIVPPDLDRRLAEQPGVAGVLRVTDMYVTDAQGRQTVLRVADPGAVQSMMRREVAVPAEGEIVLPTSATVATGVGDGGRAAFTFFDGEVRELTVRRSDDQWALAAPGSVPAWPEPRLPDGSPWPPDVQVPDEFVPRAELWLRMDPDLSGTGLENALEGMRTAVTETSPSLAVTEAFQSREQVRSTIDTVLTASSLLLAVAVAIAVVGVVNTLSLAVAERGRELALLRGVGVTRGGLGLMICFEALLVGASAAALGVLLGAVLGRLGAQALVGPETIGNVSTPVRNLTGVGIGGAAAALVAAAITSVPASRTPVAGI